MKKGNLTKSCVVSLLTVIFILTIMFWHHNHYTHNYFQIVWPYFDLGSFAVGGFVFLSGYKLMKSKLSDSFGQFWKRRIVRIYPLYFIAIILFAVLIHNDLNIFNFMKHALALQIIFPKLFGSNYLTVYFIGLIALYYLFFSLTKNIVANIKRFLSISISIFFVCGIVAIISQEFGIFQSFGLSVFHYRFFLFFFFFVSGMLFSYHEDKFTKIEHINKILLIPIISALILLVVYWNIYIPSKYVKLAVEILLINASFIPLFIVLLTLKSRYQINDFKKKLINKMAYASYCVYLFHRPMWQIMANVWPEHSFAQWLFIIPFGITMIFVVGYYTQLIYDKIVEKFESK